MFESDSGNEKLIKHVEWPQLSLTDHVLFSQDDEMTMNVPQQLCDTPEYKELMQLKEQRQQMLQSLDPSMPRHIGYKVQRKRETACGFMFSPLSARVKREPTCVFMFPTRYGTD